MFNDTLVALIGESLAAVWQPFDRKRFTQLASQGLDQQELKGRAALIARAMAEVLPQDFPSAAEVLIASFGPQLQATNGNGLAPFFYYPHSEFIGTFGVEHFKSGMQANYELTQRFTAEFSIRPYVIAYQSPCLKLLKTWASDPNPHVRRLVSEGTRPRLPWGMGLPAFQADMQLTLPLLELLKDDPALYVRRSVANHLGDLAKDHREGILDVCERWLSEVRDVERTVANNRRWLIRHAVRHPDKQGHARACKLRKAASALPKR
jgi:3-methyladenine DNA glycosylase AlkC